MLEDSQNLARQGLEHPALTGPALSRQLDKLLTQDY